MSTIETSSVASADTIVAPASGQATGAPLSSTTTEGFAQFLDGFRKYESVLVSQIIYKVYSSLMNTALGIHDKGDIQCQVQAGVAYYRAMLVTI